MTLKRRPAVRSLLLAIAASAAVGTVAVQAADGYTTSDLNDFNLSTSYSTWPSQFHINSGTDGAVSYRWLDSTPQTTVIAAVSCIDGSLFGSQSSYSAGDTTYHGLFTGSSGGCFQVKGRTNSGSMNLYDGRVQR